MPRSGACGTLGSARAHDESVAQLLRYVNHNFAC